MIASEKRPAVAAARESSEAPRLQQELDRIQRWSTDRQAALEAELREAEEEERRLRETLAELQRKLESNAHYRQRVQEQLSGLPGERLARQHAALKESLTEERELVLERSRELEQERARRRQRFEQAIEDPELAREVEEYLAFEQTAGVLESLPASYREAVLSVHRARAERLAPLLALAEGRGEPLDLPPQTVALVAALEEEPAEGRPEALALLVPVPYAVYRDWTERPEDLAACLAYRAVAGISSALARLGVAVPVEYREALDVLSIQLWLGDASLPGDFREVFEGALVEALERGEEFQEARIRPRLLWVPAEVVAPPEGEELDPGPAEPLPAATLVEAEPD